jgi:serine/threonine protein kinase
MTEFIGEQQHRNLGNYELLRLLGKGRHTEIYLGKHIHLKSQAAVKIFHKDLSENERESRLAGLRRIAALRHPHIVRILEFGNEGDRQFLVSEYALHGSLRQRYGPGEQLPLPTVMAYVGAITAALQYVHERGLVHGAIKPENMLLGQDDRVLLTDFRALLFSPNNGSGALVAPEHVEAPTYLAPEQWQGLYSPASDQYALAVVVYEWLSGAPPFQGSPTALRELHCHATPPPLPVFAVQMPHKVEQVLHKALAKDPQQRFADVQAFAQAFMQAVGRDVSSGENTTLLLPQEPVLAHPVEPGLSTSRTIEKTVPQFSTRQQVSVRRSRVRPLIIALSCLLALLLIGSGLLIFQRGTVSPSQAGLTPAREATMSAMSTQDLYSFATSGQPIISDNLDRPQSSRWSTEQKNQGKGSCMFRTVGGTTVYHLAIQAGAPPITCFARNSNFSNFAFQVNMLDTQGSYDNEAGIAFCGNNTGSTFDLFSVFSVGYDFTRYEAGRANLLTSGTLPITMSNLGNSNQLTVIAHNGHYSLYVDGRFIAKQDETRVCSGSIGVFTGHQIIPNSRSATSDYAFSDARVWQL